MICDPDMAEEESGSVDAAVDPPELDDPPDTDADEDMLLQGEVV